MSQSTEGKAIMVSGRIVWTSGANVFDGKLKVDDKTKQPRLDKNGNQVKEFGFGLAIPKVSLSQDPNTIWGAMVQQAQSIYPNGIPPNFAYKYKDGDGIDHNGASFALREGHAGHLILACTQTLPIKFFRFENGQNVLINEGIKCGDYVDVQLTVKAHGPQAGVAGSKPGLYLNPGMVRFNSYGKEIVNTPSGDAIFGAQAPQALGSAAPLANPNMIMGTSPQGPALMGYAPPQQPVQAPIPQPNYQVLPPVLQPQQPMQAPIPNFAPQVAQQPTMQPPLPPQQQQQWAPPGGQPAPQMGGMPQMPR